jgi:hypothetical protein
MSRHYWETPKPIRVLRSSKRAGVRKYEVNSSSDARRRYTVTVKNGKWACSCLGWIIPRREHPGSAVFVRKPCRHIVAVARIAVSR